VGEAGGPGQLVWWWGGGCGRGELSSPRDEKE